MFLLGIKKTTCFGQQWPSSGFIQNYMLKKECFYNVRHCVSMLRSHHLCAGQKFISYSLSVESF